MRVVGNLLHYWTDPRQYQSTDASGIPGDLTERPIVTPADPSAATGREELKERAAAILWGAGSLVGETDDATAQLAAMAEALRWLARPGKLAKHRDAVAASLHAAAGYLNTRLPVGGGDPFVALTATAWVYAMRQASAMLPSAEWLGTLQNILTQVDRAWGDSDADSLVPTMLWGCEVPLALAWQMPGVDGRGKLVRETRQRLRFLIRSVDNAEAMWLRRGGGDVRALLAAAVRCCRLLESLGGKPLSDRDVKQLNRYAAAALQLCRLGGGPVLHGDAGSDDGLWAAIAAAWPTGRKTRALIEWAGSPPRAAGPRRHELAEEAELPEPASHWEEAELAVMRGGWHDAPAVAVDYSADPVRLEITGPDGEPVFRGDWELRLLRGGAEVPIDSPWECVCWQSDDDVHYLELQCAAEGLCRVQRQVMLVREDHTLFLCDTLLADEPSDWTLGHSIPLAGAIVAEPSPENTELRLLAVREGKRGSVRQPAAVALPIGLSEWRSRAVDLDPAAAADAAADGELSCDGRVLHLEHRGRGDRLMCPLVVGLGEPTASAACTWRPLTVAQDLEIQPPEAARGFRVQLGRNHLLFYRSLGPLVRRTVFGLHLYTEFYAGRFDPRDGECEGLIEVSAE